MCSGACSRQGPRGGARRGAKLRPDGLAARNEVHLRRAAGDRDAVAFEPPQLELERLDVVVRAQIVGGRADPPDQPGLAGARMEVEVAVADASGRAALDDDR